MFPFFLVMGVNVHKDQKSSTDFDYLGEEILGKMSTQHQECVGFFKEIWVKHREMGKALVPLLLLPKEELMVMVISQEHPSPCAELKLFSVDRDVHP